MITGMNKKLFKQLCMNFNREADKELFELWEYNLRAFDEEEIQQAIGKIISNDKFFPTFSRLLEVIKEIVPRGTLEFDAETNVRNKMKRLGIKPDWFDKEIVNEPIDEETENIFNDFQEFIKDFRNE